VPDSLYPAYENARTQVVGLLSKLGVVSDNTVSSEGKGTFLLEVIAFDRSPQRLRKLANDTTMHRTNFVIQNGNCLKKNKHSLNFLILFGSELMVLGRNLTVPVYPKILESELSTWWIELGLTDC
jgi:hypothetical protein